MTLPRFLYVLASLCATIYIASWLLAAVVG